MRILEMVPSQMQSFLPSTIRIAAGYMVVIGLIGMVWPFLRLGPEHPEFQEQSSAYKFGARASTLTLSAASLVAGIGLFWQHAWARNLSLGVLVIGTFYAANEFAWGFSSGPPTSRVRLLSRIVVVAWNGFWFYVIYRLQH
jgi:hypothetical protein